MKNNIYYFVSTLLCLSLVNTLFSQTLKKNPDNIELTYSEVYDAPEELSLFSLSLPFYHGSFSKMNFSLFDLTGGLQYVGKGRINAGLKYKYGLADKLLPDTEETNGVARHDHVMSVFEPGHAQNFDAYATFFFAQKEKKVSTSFILKTTGHYYKTTYYTRVPTKQLIKHGVNLGYSQGFTWYNMNNMDLILHNKPNDVTKTVNLQSMSSVQNYKFIKLGYQKQSTINAKMKFSKYGVREEQNIVVTGVNFIYALQNDFEDVYLGDYQSDYTDKIIYERYEIDPSNKFLNVGVEFYQRIFMKRNFYSVEYRIAYLPGMMNNLNFVFNVGINFQIDFFRNNLRELDKLIESDGLKPLKIDGKSNKKDWENLL